MTHGGITKLLRKGIDGLKTGTAGTSLEEVKRKYGLTQIVKLASNENPLGASPKAAQILKESASEMNIYPDPNGLKVRTQIASHRDVKTEQVLHGNGSAEIITFLGEVFINEGDECIIPATTYQRYGEVISIMGGKRIFSPLKDYRIDLEDMAQRVTPLTKLIVIANPNNPTGDIVRQNEVKAFLNIIRKDIIVVFDEAYAEYVEDQEYPNTVDLISQGYNIVALRTFSKAYGMAGVRIGYAISNSEIIRLLNSVRSVFNVNRFAQLAAVEALKDREHLNKSINLVWDEKKFYTRQLKNLDLFFIPTSANFVFVKVGVDDLKLHETMVQKGIIIRPMTAWGYKGFIRITIGTHEQNEKMFGCLRESLKELK